MYCKILLFFLVSLNTGIGDCDLETLRTEFDALDTKEELHQFLDKYGSVSCEAVVPYVAAATMQRAKYAFLPTKKWHYFVKGRNQLENYIKSNPGSVEAHYVRLMVQTSIPWFLGYKDHIKSDVEFIRNNIESSDLPEDYKGLILYDVNNLNLN